MSNSQPRIREYVDIFFYRKELFIVPFVSIAIVSIVLSFLLPSVYRATVKIEIVASPLISTYDISDGVRQQLVVLKERIFSQSTLANIAEKAGLGKVGSSSAIQKFIGDLRNNTSISLENDQLIKVSYDGRNKNRTIRIVKIISNAFIEESFIKRGEEANTAVDFIGSELKLYRDKLEKKDSVIKQPDPLVRSIGARLAKLEEQLAELSIDSNENHPMVADLKRSIEETKAELKRTNNGKDIDEQKLEDVRMEREMRMTEALYGQLLNKLEVVRISQRLKGEEEKTKFRIIDLNQTMVNRIAPNRNKIVFSGFALGIIFGIGLIILAELADHSFKDTDDAKAFLNLPLLGSIPKTSVK